MSALRYERVSDPDSTAVVDHVSVYNPEQIDDTTAIMVPSGDLDSFNDAIGFREIFNDPRLSTKQQKLCAVTLLTVACLTVLMLVSLFAGFGKVLFDITASEERARHGVLMIPNLRAQSSNVMFYNKQNRTENVIKYAKQIDDYLKQYRSAQDYMSRYLKNCTAEEKASEKEWCSFDVAKEFGQACSKSNDYGYRGGRPCILFAFEDRLNWVPNMRYSSSSFLPFLCRMQYQYSSHVLANTSYYPSLPGSPHHGGFYLNQVPSRAMRDFEGNEVVEKDGDVMYSLPPLVMVQLSFPQQLGPFTMDCRIKDNVNGFELKNIDQFKGQIGVAFDFAPTRMHDSLTK